jgi:tetratricopeptide (TPR) repeat protein
MTSQQARLFIDYILGMPDRTGASQYVHFSAFRLDDTFFEELDSLIAEAEDRKDNGRQQSLEWLVSVASDARRQAHAPFAVAAEKSSRRRVHAEPQTDYSRAMQAIELDRRVTDMTMRTHFNPVNDAVIADWKNIVDGYRELIEAGPPKTPLYTMDSLRLKVAQSLESLARAYASLYDEKQSSMHYKQAAKAFEEAGEPVSAARCRSRLDEDRMAEEAEYDEQMQGVLEDLENFDKLQPEHLSRLVDLGELQARAGDDFAAEKTLLKAESDLKAAEWGNPRGSELAEALTATMKAVKSGQNVTPTQNIQTSLFVRGIHRRIHLALSNVYQRLGDAKKANDRLELATEMDRSSPDDEFSTTMNKLIDEWKNLFG